MLRALSLATLFVVFGSSLFGYSAEPDVEKPPLNKEFAEQLLKIAQEYESYGRVDDQTRVAPAFCAAPSGPKPVAAKVSASDDAKTHGRKLYYVFAKDQSEYLGYDPKAKSQWAKVSNDVPHPVGQVIVKESWVPEKVAADAPQKAVDASAVPAGKKQAASPPSYDSYLPFVKLGDDLYHAKEKSALFIMFKLAADTPDTDRGWVYGTVSADGKTATSAGRVQSCMKCHAEAPRDRLFGMK